MLKNGGSTFIIVKDRECVPNLAGGSQPEASHNTHRSSVLKPGETRFIAS
jgi:hypothetical protein